jgi:hypothetical protein
MYLDDFNSKKKDKCQKTNTNNNTNNNKSFHPNTFETDYVQTNKNKTRVNTKNMNDYNTKDYNIIPFSDVNNYMDYDQYYSDKQIFEKIVSDNKQENNNIINNSCITKISSCNI